ncbi:lactate utilization protein [Carboxylicivirga sediminis]|uniref:Lactate utilization protein n=1 Tax=Carboxylicivirga sediminis TaxID=2006564 RepID=A0A941F1N1_9BACT|nr:lactate utilization protein [Carboxylicivirga sediminis]MBR8534727.1 lactate utilization protein [Carboxylicivirga sediminis]
MKLLKTQSLQPKHLRMIMHNRTKKISDKARANILSRLESADQKNSGLMPERVQSAAVFSSPDNLLSTFIDEFEKVNGQVVVCDNQLAVARQLVELADEHCWNNVFCLEESLLPYIPDSIQLGNDEDFESMQVGITGCELLIARTGSVMVSSAVASGRRLNVFPPVHVIIANVDQLVPFLDDAISRFNEKYKDNMPSQATVITGPSRTADIEKTLVMGAHGPKELIVLIHQ